VIACHAAFRINKFPYFTLHYEICFSQTYLVLKGINLFAAIEGLLSQKAPKSIFYILVLLIETFKQRKPSLKVKLLFFYENIAIYLKKMKQTDLFYV